MILLGKKLNLAEHYAGMRRHFASTIYMPADIEGHLGEDGRLYLLDTARVMPPTYPDKSVRGSFLFRLFRPEFVKNYSKPLSSGTYLSLTDITITIFLREIFLTPLTLYDMLLMLMV